MYEVKYCENVHFYEIIRIRQQIQKNRIWTFGLSASNRTVRVHCPTTSSACSVKCSEFLMKSDSSSPLNLFFTKNKLNWLQKLSWTTRLNDSQVEAKSLCNVAVPGVHWKRLWHHQSEVPLFFFLSGKDVKAAILEDMLRLGKEGGLKSFEQVHLLIIKDLKCLFLWTFLCRVDPL